LPERGEKFVQKLRMPQAPHANATSIASLRDLLDGIDVEISRRSWLQTSWLCSHEAQRR
jgi:hypothetical protein